MKKYLPQLFTGFCLVTLMGYATAQLPDAQVQNGIQYITGGIGSEESDAIKAESKHWSLQIMFSEVTPERSRWVADINFQIKNSSNEVILKAISDGPLVLVKLPNGLYTVSAIYSGVEVQQHFEIKAGVVQKLSIFWKHQEGSVE